KELFRRGKVFGLGRNTRIVVGVEWLALELRGAIEAHTRAYNHVANLKLLADAAGGAGSDDEFRLYLVDDLRPDIDIRKLRAILRHMRIGFEDHHVFSSDLRGPIRAQTL